MILLFVVVALWWVVSIVYELLVNMHCMCSWQYIVTVRCNT